MTVSRDVLDLLAGGGAAAYFGEHVTQLDHALQCAALAESDGASEALVVAALVHDVGHLLQRLGESAARRGIDALHEIAGARWLAHQRFPLSVTEPIRLHVAAKRYLSATDAAYAAALSPASRQSLALQGGPFGAEEIDVFERAPHHDGAVALRRWDDLAKVPGRVVPGLEHYRERVLRARS